MRKKWHDWLRRVKLNPLRSHFVTQILKEADLRSFIFENEHTVLAFMDGEILQGNNLPPAI